MINSSVWKKKYDHVYYFWISTLAQSYTKKVTFNTLLTINFGVKWFRLRGAQPKICYTENFQWPDFNRYSVNNWNFTEIYTTENIITEIYGTEIYGKLHRPPPPIPRLFDNEKHTLTLLTPSLKLCTLKTPGLFLSIPVLSARYALLILFKQCLTMGGGRLTRYGGMCRFGFLWELCALLFISQ